MTRKMIMLCAVAMMSTATFAQSAAQLAKQQAELNAIHMKLLNAKPTKTAKKEAKQLQKEGWQVPAGGKSIEQQITESQLYDAELMAGEDGATVKRYILQGGMTTSGTYNTGYAAARTSAQVELAAALRTQLYSSIKQEMANSQTTAVSAVTIDKFNQKSEAMVDETLTNSIPVLAIYRRLDNGNFEVQVRLAFDKKEILSRLKRSMQRELEQGGENLYGVAEKVVNKF